MLLLADAAHPGARPPLACRPERFPPGARAIVDLKPDACRWPCGEVADEDFAFCGAPRLRGSYCALHAPLSRQGRR